ncbi:MAG: hypothetical protein WBD20_06510 [Pirellulaceae bacterium]
MIGNLLFYLMSLSLPFGLVLAMSKRCSERWNRLARAYPVVDGIECVAKRTMQTVILDGGSLQWNSYKGIVTVGVTSKGILLKVMPPFSIFHPPILIPYRECQVEPRRWYLIGKTVQYTLRQAGNVKVIIHEDTQEWIESQVASLAIAQADTPISDDEFAGIQATG